MYVTSPVMCYIFSLWMLTVIFYYFNHTHFIQEHRWSIAEICSFITNATICLLLFFLTFFIKIVACYITNFYKSVWLILFASNTNYEIIESVWLQLIVFDLVSSCTHHLISYCVFHIMLICLSAMQFNVINCNCVLFSQRSIGIGRFNHIAFFTYFHMCFQTYLILR